MAKKSLWTNGKVLLLAISFAFALLATAVTQAKTFSKNFTTAG